MNDGLVEMLEILTRAYVELNKLHAEPGNQCHMLASSMHKIEALLKQLVKHKLGA